MKKNKILVLFVAMIFYVMATGLYASAQAETPTKEKVVRAWYRQFRRIRTLQLHSALNIRDLMPPRSTTMNYDFTFSGGKYRGVTTYVNSATEREKGYSTSSIGVFDGKEYGALKVTDQTAFLNVGEKSTQLNSMGFLPLNVSVLFFNEEPGNLNWILRMQQQEPWEQLVKRIQSVKSGKRNGTNGYWVELLYRGGKVTLFLNQDLYPTYKQIVRRGITSSSEIQSKKYVVDGNDFFIPTQVVSTVTNAKGQVTEIWTQKLTQPAKINQPIKNGLSLFSIPRSQARDINNTDNP